MSLLLGIGVLTYGLYDLSVNLTKEFEWSFVTYTEALNLKQGQTISTDMGRVFHEAVGLEDILAKITDPREEIDRKYGRF